MKPIIVLICLCLCYASAFADVIIMKDGTTIKCYNVDKGSEYIYYTLSASKNAAIKKVSREKVFAVKTDADSEPQMLDAPEKEVAVEEKQSDSATSDGLLELMPSPENAAEIAKYNVVHGQYDNKVSNGKKTDECLTFWGVTSNSMLCTDIINIAIVPENGIEENHRHEYKPFAGSCYLEEYLIKLTNKTSKPLYIDLGNTLRLNGDEIDRIYFDGTSMSSSNSSEHGVNLGIGAIANALGIGGTVGSLANGISVGKGASKGISKTISQQRVLMIPPFSALYLPKKPQVFENSIYWYGEFFFRFYHIPNFKPALKKWESQTFSENTSPIYIKYFITFSQDREFNKYYQVPFTLYMKELIGIPGSASINAYNVRNANNYMIIGHHICF